MRMLVPACFSTSPRTISNANRGFVLRASVIGDCLVIGDWFLVLGDWFLVIGDWFLVIVD